MATRQTKTGSKRRGVAPVGATAPAGRSQRRPEFIIVFREVSERRNVATLERLVGTVSSKQQRGRRVLAMHKGKEARPRVQLYQELGVAAADLTKDQHEAMSAQEDVLVVKNELRSIPRDPQPLRPLGDVGGPTQPFAAVGGPSQPFGWVGGPRQPFQGVVGPGQPFSLAGGELVSYLRGYRDAVNTLVAQLESGLSGAAIARRAFESGEILWNLTMIGIGSNQSALTGSGIKVAVLDTGIDLAHPDFADRFSDSSRLRSFVPNEDVQDLHGHGTHVAGTVTGPLSATPRYGVAPACDLYVAKVLDKDGFGYDSDILDAIQWAVEQEVRVINLSLGSKRERTTPHAQAYEVVAQRLSDRAGGALIVAAAGNESQRQLGHVAPVGNPAACPSIMAVAAVDRAGGIGWFSCGQQDPIGTLDLAAPGVDIHSAVHGGGHAEQSGTSMAAPHVTGVAALFLEHDAAMTPRQLWQRLQMGARAMPLPPVDVGSGLVQAPPQR